MGKYEKRNNQKKNPYKDKKAGKKPGKGYSHDTRSDKEAMVTTEASNDAAWSMRNPTMARAAATIGYANVLGIPMSLGHATDGPSVTGITIPGIMTLHYTPTLGVSENGSSSLNVNARLLYAWIRSWNSGSRNYEAPDLFMMCTAMGSVYAYYAEMRRVYGLFQVFTPDNRYIAKPLIEALGYNYDDLVSNLASFRYYLNLFAVKANSIAVPKTLTYFDRAAWMTSHVFRDSKTRKPQLYAFVPDKYYVLDPTNPTGTALKQERAWTGVGGRTLSDIISFGDSMLDNLLRNEDIAIMSGDILKAFKESGLRVLAAVEENYATVPVYDETALAQIHNAYIGGGDVVATVTQADGNIITNPEMVVIMPEYVDAGFELTQILDSGMDEPTVEFNLEACKLKPCLTYPTNDDEDPYVAVKSCGTEIINAVYMYNLVDGELSSTQLNNSMSSPELGTWGATQRMWTFRNAFDWHPITYHCHYDSSDGPTTVEIYPEGEIFNYTQLENTTLSKMHSVTIQSYFQVPEMVTPV